MNLRWLCFSSLAVCSLSWAQHAQQGHGHPILPPAATVPGESIYQLPLKLEGHDGREIALASLRGKPVVITMIYTHCAGVCPAIASGMKRLEAALTPQQRAQTQWLMVSFDPKRDTPAALKAFADANTLDTRRWRLARTDESSVRELAAVLGVRYRELPGGVFSHSTVIAVLDRDGVIQANSANPSDPAPDLLAALKKQLD